MDICTSINIHTYKLYIYTSIFTYIYKYMYTSIYINIRLYEHTCIHTDTDLSTRYLYMYISTFQYVIYIYIWMYKYKDCIWVGCQGGERVDQGDENPVQRWPLTICPSLVLSLPPLPSLSLLFSLAPQSLKISGIYYYESRKMKNIVVYY
jgi:hypothetical protein